VSAAIDSSGVRELVTHRRFRFGCCIGDTEPTCRTWFQDQAPVVATQAGWVGSQVSNGLYNLDIPEFPTVTCNRGENGVVSYQFLVEAADFHGNRVSSPWHTVPAYGR
jgi:hypothetical protein